MWLSGHSAPRVEPVRIEPEAFAALAAEAEADPRPVGSLIRNVLAAWLADRSQQQEAA